MPRPPSPAGSAQADRLGLLAGHEGDGVGCFVPGREDRPGRSAERHPQRRICPIADALQVVGDRWALLTIRELGFGVTRFNDIQARTGAPRASLAARLRELEDAGLVERHRYSSHPPRDEYRLTPAGRELSPVLRELRAWGERHAAGRPSAGTRGD